MVVDTHDVTERKARCLRRSLIGVDRSSHIFGVSTEYQFPDARSGAVVHSPLQWIANVTISDDTRTYIRGKGIKGSD
jgi:hypothetical protein